MRREGASVGRAVLAFATSGLAVLLLVGIGGVIVLRRIGATEAERQAERLAVVAARGVVEPRLTEGIVRSDSKSLVTIDSLVNGAVLKDPIVAVRIWDRSGRILYSDEPSQIGATYGLDPDQLDALRTGTVAAVDSDPSLPANRSGRGLGPLLEVSVPIATPAGEELLFEALIRVDAVAASARRLWIAFLPVLALALLALAALQIPFAVRLARRVERSQADRERLLTRAIESSDLERRRIAAELHDGSVQQLAGLSMSLEATAGSLDPEAAAALRDAAAATRQGVRSLRSALMGIYPASLRRAGLQAAISDLTAPLAVEGAQLDVSVPGDLELPLDVESLLYRASREAIRNISKHARAEHVRATVFTKDRRAVLEVEDDGVGFSPDEAASTAATGHVGLGLLSDLAVDAGASLAITSTPGRGTLLRLEVPLR